MKLQAIVSSVALAAALSFSGAAVAQNMLNGMEIPADQVQSFKGKCEALQAASTASLATPSETSNATETDPTETGSIDGQDTNADSDPAARDNWAVALASLTVAQCNEAGFVAN